MLGLLKFLEILGTLVVMKNGGQPNDVSRLINYARLGARAGATGKRELEEAVAKVQQLVDEDRSMTDEELAELDEAIQGKLARAAAVELPPEE